MTHPYSPPTSDLTVSQPATKRALRATIGFLSGFLALPALWGLVMLLFVLRLGATSISFTSEDLPSAAGWLLLLANGTLCGSCAARFGNLPMWAVAASGFAIPALLLLGSLAVAITRHAA